MPTPLELRLIHLAYRQAGLAEEHYRMVLRNIAGAASAKELTQHEFEDVMSVLEDSGFRHQGKPANYWRMKVLTRGSFCSARMIHLIEHLAGQQKYDLAALCRQVTRDRVSHLDKLTPREGAAMIATLKDIVERAAATAAPDLATQTTDCRAAEAAGGGPVARVEAGMASETVPAAASG